MRMNYVSPKQNKTPINVSISLAKENSFLSQRLCFEKWYYKKKTTTLRYFVTCIIRFSLSMDVEKNNGLQTIFTLPAQLKPFDKIGFLLLQDPMCFLKPLAREFARPNFWRHVGSEETEDGKNCGEERRQPQWRYASLFCLGNSTCISLSKISYFL